MNSVLLKEYVKNVLSEEVIDDINSLSGFYYDPKKYSVKDLVQYAHKYKNFYPEVSGNPRSTVSKNFFTHFSFLMSRYGVPNDVVEDVLNALVDEFESNLRKKDIKKITVDQTVNKLRQNVMNLMKKEFY